MKVLEERSAEPSDQIEVRSQNALNEEPLLPQSPATDGFANAVNCLSDYSATDPEAHYTFEKELSELCESLGIPAPELTGPGGAITYYFGERITLFNRTVAENDPESGHFRVTLNDSEFSQLAHKLECFAKKEFETFIEDFTAATSTLVSELERRKIDTVVVLGNSGIATAIALERCWSDDSSQDVPKVIYANSEFNAELYAKPGSKEMPVAQRAELLDQLLLEQAAGRVAVLDDHVASGIKLDRLSPVIEASQHRPPLLIIAAKEKFLDSGVSAIGTQSEEAIGRAKNYLGKFSEALKHASEEARSTMERFHIIPPELADTPIIREYARLIDK